MKSIKLKSAFCYNLYIIAIALILGIGTGFAFFYAVAIVFGMILPACSTQN